jgi:hypothetical protein
MRRALIVVGALVLAVFAAIFLVAPQWRALEAREALEARREREAARDFMARQETLVREKAAAAALVYGERKEIINELFAIVSGIDFVQRGGSAIDVDATPLPDRFPRIREISQELEGAGFEYIGLKSLAEDGMFWLGFPMLCFPEEEFRARLFLFSFGEGDTDINDIDSVESYKSHINISSAIIPLDPLDDIWWVGYIVYPPAMLEEAKRLREMYEANKAALLNLRDALDETSLYLRMADNRDFYRIWTLKNRFELGGGDYTAKTFSAVYAEIAQKIQPLIEWGLCDMEFTARIGAWYDLSEYTGTYKAIKKYSGARIVLYRMEEGNGLYGRLFVPIERLDEGWMIGFIFGSGVPGGT